MRGQRLGVAALAAVLIAAAATAAGSCTKPEGESTNGTVVARTDAGLVRGRSTAEHRVFQGIRYAAPPRGELRWRAPHPVTPWTGIRDAFQPGSPCPQLPSQYSNIGSVNEDCLFLNVTAPRAAHPGAGKPVMVWVHGDGAAGAGEFFDATRLGR